MARYGIRYGVAARLEVGGKPTFFAVFVDQISNFRSAIRAWGGRVRVRAWAWAVDGNGLLVRFVRLRCATQLVNMVASYPSVANVGGNDPLGLPRWFASVLSTHIRFSIT